jgi:type II secretory pathway component PulC
MRGEAVIRRVIEISLCVAIAVVSWSLVVPWLPHEWGQHTAKNQVVPTPYAASKPDSQALAALIAHDHLFGVIPPEAATNAPAPVASTPEFQLNGIVYSSDPSESVALLDQGGVGVIVHNGMQLSDGQRVVSIEPDRVVVDRQGARVSVLLNLKIADINAHFSPAQFADSGESDQKQQGDNQEPSAFTDSQASLNGIVGMVTGNRPVLVTPNFKSLRQLRGRNAMRRFENTAPPNP